MRFENIKSSRQIRKFWSSSRQSIPMMCTKKKNKISQNKKLLWQAVLEKGKQIEKGKQHLFFRLYNNIYQNIIFQSWFHQSHCWGKCYSPFRAFQVEWHKVGVIFASNSLINNSIHIKISAIYWVKVPRRNLYINLTKNLQIV